MEVDAERAWIVESQLGVAAGTTAAWWTTFDVEVTNADGFVEWALRQGPAVRVAAPAALRDRVIAGLREVLERHGGAPA